VSTWSVPQPEPFNGQSLGHVEYLDREPAR
jgi:hypothetical protein